MTAQQTCYRHLHVFEVLGGVAALVGEVGRSVDAAGATHEYLAVVLGVEVQQDVALYHVSADVLRALKTDFLIDGEQGLQRAVHQAVVYHHGHSCRQTDAVVGSEGRPLGLYPVAVHVCLDGIRQEIMLHAVVLLGHHVHVGLQHDCRRILVARCGRLAHHHVSGLVGLHFDAVLLGEVHQEFADLLLVA